MEATLFEFSHLTDAGQPAMVDVSEKAITKRTATAVSKVIVDEVIIQQFQQKEIYSKKGPVFQTAIIAGTMAVKNTASLIPLCHQLPIENCKIDIMINQNNEIEINCTVSITGKTGVEMEALTGASIAALTIYDMCKSFSHNIVIKETKLIEKTGGKSDIFKS